MLYRQRRIENPRFQKYDPSAEGGPKEWMWLPTSLFGVPSALSMILCLFKRAARARTDRDARSMNFVRLLQVVFCASKMVRYMPVQRRESRYRRSLINLQVRRSERNVFLSPSFSTMCPIRAIASRSRSDDVMVGDVPLH
jgi:hypothetical protein